jgi:CspA family cold shock protein
MAKTDNWQRRRRSEKGFDEFASFPDPLPTPPTYPRRPTPSAPMSNGPESTAVVKWFNAEKGFGFVEMTEGTGDVFLHASVLARTGVTAVSPGATLKVRIGQGQKGPQVTEVTEVDESTASASPATRSPRPPGGGYGGGGGSGSSFGGGQRRNFDSAAPSGPEQQGTVKWYNTSKGFGFVAPEDGGKDVFVHASALRRAGITELAEGQRVTMQVTQGQKGPEAASIRIS